MDGAPLDRAYSAAKNADAAVISGDFSKAATLFEESAEFFDEVRAQSPDNKSVRTLQALADQYRSRAEYCRCGKAEADLKKHLVSPSSSTSIGTAASTATSGAPSIAGSGRQASRPHWTESNIGSSQHFALNSPALNGTALNGTALNMAGPSGPGQGIVAPLSESVNVLVMRSAAVFARTFEQAISDKPASAPASGLTNMPSESFYLVKPQTTKGHRNLPSAQQAGVTPNANSGPVGQVTLTSFDRTQAISQATNAQRTVLKSGLQQLLTEVASKEQQINDEHTEEVDRLRAENDRLKIQVSKLKSRWEDLKESARKRQTGDQ